MKIYGPYKRKDGRLHLLIINDDGSRKTQSYPRYIMEQHLGRKLSKEETIDHIDNDVRNNSIDNLQLLSLSDNIRKSHKKMELMEFKCPTCGVEFVKQARDYRHNQLNQGKKGPFCSRRCVGLKYN